MSLSLELPASITETAKTGRLTLDCPGGVGKVIGQVFDQLSIRTIGQLRQVPIETLAGRFGSSGEHFWKLAH